MWSTRLTRLGRSSKWVLIGSMIVVGGGLILVRALTPDAQAQTTDIDYESELFAPVVSVIRHPRCMNCHTATNFPRQNDDRTRHILNVMRGPDDHGTAGLRCSACHGETNDDIAGVPGAPHWGLAPREMAWEYMTDSEICRQLKDRSRNGDKSIAQLHEHMVADPLVLWAWAPGRHPDGSPRSLPPHDLPTFRAAMDAWTEAGAPCPAEERE